jgi:hypothetical protein
VKSNHFLSVFSGTHTPRLPLVQLIEMKIYI